MTWNRSVILSYKIFPHHATSPKCQSSNFNKKKKNEQVSSFESTPHKTKRKHPSALIRMLTHWSFTHGTKIVKKLDWLTRVWNLPTTRTSVAGLPRKTGKINLLTEVLDWHSEKRANHTCRCLVTYSGPEPFSCLGILTTWISYYIPLAVVIGFAEQYGYLAQHLLK